MGVVGKLDVTVEIKSCGDLFHELFGSKPHEVSKAVPHKVHASDVHHGDFGQPGSVISWDYTIDGKKCVAKERVEEINKDKKLVRFKIIEGDLLKEFNILTISCHVIPKGEVTAVDWIAEFEKSHDDGPYPTKIMDFIIGITKDIEAHHLKDN